MKAVFDMLAELKARLEEKGRAVFMADKIQMVLYENETDHSFVLEEQDYGAVCFAFSLDDALSCRLDHTGDGNVQMLDE